MLDRNDINSVEQNINGLNQAQMFCKKKDKCQLGREASTYMRQLVKLYAILCLQRNHVLERNDINSLEQKIKNQAQMFCKSL